MTLLKAATGGSYLKAGFLGFAGGGKTHTAFELAFGTRKLFDLKGPIAMFDTESGSDYWRDRVKKETGTDLLVVKSRSLTDLMVTTREAAEAGASVLIVDSITHVWREVGNAYLAAKNANQRAKGWRVSDKLEFQDWSRIKNEWSQWPDWFLNSPMHAIVCGRAGYEYDMQEGEDGRKSELIKTGIKMKVEGEFGFEPSLVVEMTREFAVDKKGQVKDERTVINRATVLKDRYGDIDGKTASDPTFEFFKPHVQRLRAIEHSPVNTEVKTEFQLDEAGRDKWEHEKKAREILREEIQGLMTSRWPGQSAEDKKAKVECLARYFNTRSWTAVEQLSSEVLSGALAAMREGLEAAA
jgi:hypothetical protein